MGEEDMRSYLANILSLKNIKNYLILSNGVDSPFSYPNLLEGIHPGRVSSADAAISPTYESRVKFLP